MIYKPVMDELTKIIQGEIEHLSVRSDASSAIRELRRLGKPAVNHVLLAVEKPLDHPRYKLIRHHCLTLLKWYVEDGVMSMSELQRYRQILASEKDSNAS